MNEDAAERAKYLRAALDRLAAPAPPSDAELRAWLESEWQALSTTRGEFTQEQQDRWQLLRESWLTDALVALIRDAIVATGKRG